MKRTLKLIVALFAVAISLNTAFGQVNPPPVGVSTSTAVLSPPVGEASSSAIPSIGQPILGTSESARRIVELTSLAGDPYVGVDITVVPVLLPPQNMASSWEARKQFQEDYLRGTLRTNSNYTVIDDGVINWRNTVYGEGVDVSWKVLQWFVFIKSKDGSDSISLLMLQVNAMSTGGLNSSFMIKASDYHSDIVVGYPKNGPPVVSGPPNQPVAALVATVQMSLFNGGATSAGLDQVRTYVMGLVKTRGNFTITCAVTMAGDTTSIGTASVSIRVPRLEWILTGIKVIGDDTGDSYDLLSSDKITGPWGKITTLRYGEVWPVNKTRPTQFYRAVLSQ